MSKQNKCPTCDGSGSRLVCYDRSADDEIWLDEPYCEIGVCLVCLGSGFKEEGNES